MNGGKRKQLEEEDVEVEVAPAARRRRSSRKAAYLVTLRGNNKTI